MRVKKGEDILIHFDADALSSNADKIITNESIRGLSVAFIVKHQLLNKDVFNVLKNKPVKIYTTRNMFNGVTNMYDCEDTVIVDAFEQREGISLEEASRIKHKRTAVVNFYCCENRLPSDYDLTAITRELRDMGFVNVSLGGSMLIEYDYAGYDEIRVGEAMLTGYSTVFNKYFEDLVNPYTLHVDVYGKRDGRIILKHGFLEIGGFTNAKTVCVNTDFTVIEDNDTLEYTSDGKLILKPDYFTLIKLAHKRE